MKVEEISFREIYHQICLLSDADLVKSINLRDVFDFPPDEKLDGFLTYACIDDGIFIFEILAGAKVSGGRIKIFPGSYKKSAKLKRGQVEDADIKILTTEYALPFRDRIYMIDDRIAVDDVKEQTRLIKNLDAFRHPDYPDDVVVYFFSAEEKPELLWVRCISVDENILNGELLNEPTKTFGCHVGDKIKFGVAQIGEQNILLYLPTGGNTLA
ncbi:MAG: DUF2314 domain-containing protein [Selenomonadaceae bacterium]|nr:DUF2314 domain-containing protein [Selenomonadaceae bacterium]